MTPRMSAAVGADVEALCSKCGDVWHVVVAKVGEAIVKVQCKQCGGYHRYKSPHGAPKEKRMPSQFAPKPERAAKAPVERFEKPAVAADLTKAVRQYAASLKYNVGERIPRILVHCGHTLCTNCIQQLHHKDRVRCPICRKLIK